MSGESVEGSDRRTYWQRILRRRLLRTAGKRHDQLLGPEDWEAYYEVGTHVSTKLFQRLMHALPRNPRCRLCGAPFEGFGSHLVKPLGYKPSRKNPQICATCVELAPPGGMTMDVGVLFADVRNFTALSERTDPQALSRLLRRFYACAERALFPQALIDKLIGDEVMALYIPRLNGISDPSSRMLDDARELLSGVGYGAADGPFLEVGVGITFGEAFVGNIGDRALFDFTAVGDVVNTAARLQSEAAGGEIVLSGRVASGLAEVPSEHIELTLKGKAEPVMAYRLRF